MGDRRYYPTLSFWLWCDEHRITMAELGRETGYSASTVNSVRLAIGSRTVSQRFVDRVEARYIFPAGARFFRQASADPTPGRGHTARRAPGTRPLIPRD